MAIGCAVTFHSARVHSEKGKEGCYVDASNYKMGLGMYFSYLVLFGMLFYDKSVIVLFVFVVRHSQYYLCTRYIKKDQKTQSTKNDVCGVDVSQVKDSAGMFRTENVAQDASSPTKSKKKKN